MIIRLKTKVPSESFDKIKRKLEDNFKDNFKDKVILIPNDIEVISNVHEIKEEDISITNIKLETESIFLNSEIVDQCLVGTKVDFKYKDINANLFIESNKLLTVKEMKREIINRFSAEVY